MDFPKLELTTEDESRAAVVTLVKDAEAQLLRAVWNRTLNPGRDGEQYDVVIAKIKDGLARIKGSPSWAKYLAPAAPAAE
jgi:hypothetical protein